jgi:histone-lysine N-methyltransferase SETMAR
MVTAFFDCRGIVRNEFVPESQTVNQDFYQSVLQRLCLSIRRRPELWASGKWFLLHNNAQWHTSISIQHFLAKHQVTVLPHAPYSPDLSPCDFFYSDNLNEQ